MSGRVVWRKKLASTDAQRVREGSNPTGCIRLTQAGFCVEGAPVDHTTYFREHVFCHLAWRARGTSPGAEEARVQCSLTIFGELLGDYELEISHKPSGEAQQRNYTTALHLNRSLRKAFQRQDVTGSLLSLVEEDGSFSIRIERAEGVSEPPCN